MEQLDPENLPGSCRSQGLCPNNWSPRSNNDFQNSLLQHQSCDIGQGKVLLFSEPQFSHLQNGIVSIKISIIADTQLNISNIIARKGSSS